MRHPNFTLGDATDKLQKSIEWDEFEGLYWPIGTGSK
jgi:hypothetical protein